MTDIPHPALIVVPGRVAEFIGEKIVISLGIWIN
jgi:hypothetical protein